MAVYNNGSDDFFGTLKYNPETKKYDEVPKGRGFDFIAITRDVDSCKINYELRIKLQDSEYITVLFSPANLNLQGITDVAEKGVDINQFNMRTFAEVLQLEHNKYVNDGRKFKNTHSYLGWDNLKICGKCFKYQNIIADENKFPNFTSTYNGTTDISLQSNFNERILEQVDVIRTYILGSTPLEVALAVGASAIVNGYISEDINSPNIIMHLMGDSSTGKTTAALVAVSVACCPNPTSDNLFKSWLGTRTSVISRIKGNYGLPVVFDEISKFDDTDMTKVVYSLSDGKDKDRCNKTGKVKPITKYDCWKTTIISTGESSLVGHCSQNTGIIARVIELNCKFTRSAEEADKIKNAVNNHYGCIAPYLAKYMLRMDKEEILDIHNKFKTQYASRSKATGLESRIGNSVGVILTAAELLNRCFNLTLDVDKILDMFLQSESVGNSNETLADRAYKYLINTITANLHHFVTEEKTRNIANGKIEIMETPVYHTDRWGKIDKEKKQVLIIHEKAKKLLNQGGFESDRVALRAMREAGYLDHDGDRNTRDRKISKDDLTPCSVVILKLPEFDEDKASSESQSTFVTDTKFKQESICDDYTEYNAEALQQLIAKYDEPYKNF